MSRLRPQSKLSPLKRTLLLIALIVIFFVSVLLYQAFEAQEEKDFAASPKVQTKNLFKQEGNTSYQKVIAPHFQGFDTQNHPFFVEAKRAVIKNNEAFYLYDINGAMHCQPLLKKVFVEKVPQKLTIKAKQAVLKSVNEKTGLFEECVIEGPKKSAFKSSSVNIDFKNKVVKSEAGVNGQLDVCRFKAKRFNGNLANNKIVLEKDVEIQFTP